VDKPEAFLMRAALNLSIDAYRLRQSHGEEVLLEDVVLLDASPSAEALLLAREQVARPRVCRVPERPDREDSRSSWPIASGHEPTRDRPAAS
jgi:DNA-directed RNA polymerase specialized sigma24 family protein